MGPAIPRGRRDRCSPSMPFATMCQSPRVAHVQSRSRPYSRSDEEMVGTAGALPSGPPTGREKGRNGRAATAEAHTTAKTAAAFILKMRKDDKN